MNNTLQNTVIECQNVSRKFVDGDLQTDVLQHINLAVKSGEMIGILGASGSGKSTLLNLMGGIDMPTQGKVMLCEQNLSQLSEKKRCLLRNQHLGFVYQFHHLLPEFNALENVMMPLCIRRTNNQQAKQQARDILGQMQLSHRLHHKPAELSGGERQRVAIARALVHQPSCVLTDEPTGNLDSKNAEYVFDLMLNLNADKHSAFVIVTHDEKLAQKLDRVLVLTDGKLT